MIWYLTGSPHQWEIPYQWTFVAGKNFYKLVGGLEHFFIFQGNLIIPTDFHIFQRGRSTTNQINDVVFQQTMFDPNPWSVDFDGSYHVLPAKMGWYFLKEWFVYNQNWLIEEIGLDMIKEILGNINEF